MPIHPSLAILWVAVVWALAIETRLRESVHFRTDLSRTQSPSITRHQRLSSVLVDDVVPVESNVLVDHVTVVIVEGSVGGLALLVLAGAGGTGAMTYTDEQTERSILLWLKAAPAGIAGLAIVESVAPGTITVPIMRALDVLGPVLILAAIALAFLLIRGWRDRRFADRVESVQGR